MLWHCEVYKTSWSTYWFDIALVAYSGGVRALKGQEQSLWTKCHWGRLLFDAFYFARTLSFLMTGGGDATFVRLINSDPWSNPYNQRPVALPIMPIQRRPSAASTTRRASRSVHYGFAERHHDSLVPVAEGTSYTRPWSPIPDTCMLSGGY